MNWLKRLFQPKKRVCEAVEQEEPKELFPDVIRPGDPAWDIFGMALQTGNPVMGNVDDEGNWTVTEIKPDGEEGETRTVKL